MSISILPIPGIGEISSGDDLAQVLLSAMDRGGIALQPGDLLVVTSKVVSKAEGRLVRGHDREAAIAAETRRIVAQRHGTTISETHHGLVMAAAGVDASDLPDGWIALLPEDPDQSARSLRAKLPIQPIGVIITDTFGRPWREGLIDQAIGVAGLAPLRDYRGESDRHGRTLQASIIAIADEIASASELVRGKALGIPAAIIRGMSAYVIDEDGPGAAAMLRSPQGDWFRYGHRDLITSRRTVRGFLDQPVPHDVIEFAVTAALTAPAPHHTHPMRFLVLESKEARTALLDAMEERWRADLSADGLDDTQIAQRISKGAVLHRAPILIAPFLVRDGAHRYPDARRSAAEERMFTVAAGASIENLLLALHGEGIGAAWISSSIFCPDEVRQSLGVPDDWEAMGIIAAGYPEGPLAPREPRKIDVEFR